VLSLCRSISSFVHRHPLSVGGTYLFCLFMLLVYLPYDIFYKAWASGIDSAEEVWFGYILRGWAAKLTEPLHAAIYASLCYGFHLERPWAWSFASLYTLQVAIGSAIWVWLYADYGPLGYALTPVVIGAFVGLAFLIWRARPKAELRPDDQGRHA